MVEIGRFGQYFHSIIRDAKGLLLNGYRKMKVGASCNEDIRSLFIDYECGGLETRMEVLDTLVDAMCMPRLKRAKERPCALNFDQGLV
ncbi:hypothetical protein Tco_1023388 [Tanacetum coccineum]